MASACCCTYYQSRAAGLQGERASPPLEMSWNGFAVAYGTRRGHPVSAWEMPPYA
jgi:hypothetical protein